MKFYVFSFNRAEFLANCVDSIARCAPDCRVAVYDDASTDDATRRVLDALARDHEVVVRDHDSRHKLGGLYANMQAAYEAGLAGGEDTVCFVQDDMQLVRPITPPDHAAVAQYFAARPRAGFLLPQFDKGRPRRRDPERLRFDPDSGSYIRAERRQGAGIHYADVAITQLSRLRAHDWRFREGEPANQRQAAMHFESLGTLFAPFLMWLPNGPAYRGKRKTRALRIAEERRACGFFPFADMTGDGIAALRGRDPEVLPTAEQFLRTRDDALPPPWTYDPLEGLSWLKKRNNFELWMRRTLRR